MLLLRTRSQKTVILKYRSASNNLSKIRIWRAPVYNGNRQFYQPRQHTDIKITSTTMNSRIRSTLIACTFILGLVGCSEEDGISSSSGGTSAGDGGAGSAQYAGTYKGTMDVKYTGDDINGDDKFPITLVINSNGTVVLTMDGETVNGTINGNNIDIGLSITQSEDGVTCKGDARVKATVTGNSLSGPVSGDAECKLLLIKKEADLTGTINASKV